ncbi:MAG: hypothetical protein OXH41_14320 [Chloroflexi bacterium]|nr:hypothetical protein [Chloroflexota bacterium]
MRTVFWQRTFVVAGLLALVGVLALGSATPGLAAHSPTPGNAASAGNASQAPATPTTTNAPAQEGEEEPAENDPQYAERDTSTDNTWIILAVVMMIVLTVLGFALAGLGLSAE